MDSTKPALNSANTNSSSAPADHDLNKAVESSDRVQINAPAKGEIQIVDVQNVEEIAFNFDLENVRVSAIDVDLVLIFPDNSKLILPGLAMNLLGSKAPRLRAFNEIIESHDIISSISQVALADTTPSIHLASADFLPKKQGGNASDDKASADGAENLENSITAAAMIVTPIRPTVTTETSGGTSANGAKVEAVEAGSIAGSKLNLASASGEPPAPKNPPPSPGSQSSSAAQGNAPFSMKAADLTIKALAISERSETEQSNGKIIVGASAGLAAAYDGSFAAQMERESLAGGSGSDIIYADDPRFSNSGSAARLLDVTVTMPTSNISARQATISGLPVGYSILNANFINGNWVMPVGTIKPNNFQIQLVYKIPDDSIKPDANGFYDRFTMSISFDGTNGGGGNGTISASTVIGIRDVNAAEDQNFIDPATGKPVIVLFRLPAGNNINAGQGDDTIYAAAGADSIDGGDGKNIVHYGNSQSGVSVNLAEGQGKGGFSEQDQYANIQSVIGSKFNDTLIGGVEANTLAGAAGADSLDGGDGFDVADYTGSTTAVTVSLLTGEGVGGDAQGDRLRNIEAVMGSTKDDVITAGSSGSTLFGGQGNDTLISGAGADSLVGGTGDNLVDYRYSASSVTVDLKTNAAYSGDAEGDLFAEIENISGSTYGDSIIGDDSANVLDGNSGDDTLFGGLGNDTLLASGGRDSLLGGAGNDVLVAGTGSSTLIGGDGNDTFNGTDGNSTVDYSYASSGVIITLNETNTATSQVSNTDRDVLIGIKDITGTSFSDTIGGNWLNNSISGGDQSDILYGGFGADTLLGDSGNDSVSGEAGDDLILGGDGQDTLSGGTGNDTINGNDGTNTVSYDYAVDGLGATIILSNAGLSTATLGDLDRDELSNIQNVIGSRYSDSIQGHDGSNLINANFGDDTISGGLGNDTLIGGGGFDYVDYSSTTNGVSINLTTGIANGDQSGLDLLQGISGVIGGSGNDTFVGNLNNNFIRTGTGVNLVTGSLGFDTIFGGTSNDTVDYSFINTAISADLSSNLVQKSGSTIQVDNIQDIENLVGSVLADNVSGNSLANSISGGAGNDTISGLAGSDTLSGDAGSDSLDGGNDNDLIVSGSNTDLLDGGDTVAGGSGNDTVYAGQGADCIRADSGNDIVYGENGADIIDLGDGNDTADGGSGADIIQGGLGNDSLDGSTGADVLDGGDESDTLMGGSENDSLVGGLGDDTLNGGLDNDTLMGGYGNDTLDGGDGSNTISFSYLGAIPGMTLMLNGSSSTTLSISSTDTDIIRNIQNVIATSGDDLVIGDTSDNSLFGAVGNDTLIGGIGADSLDGGTGANTVDYSRQNTNGVIESATTGVTVSLMTNVIGHGGNAEGDLLINIQNLIGSEGQDSLSGNATNNSIFGSGGNDVIFGDDGQDTLSGGIGNDSVSGGVGDDVVIDILGSNTLSGNEGNDNIQGGDAPNLISGGADNDTISSGSGNSTLDGGDGQDVISTIGGDNSISAGSGQDSVIAGRGADTIDAGDGNDTVLGGLGNDLITGGIGQDILYGGDQADTLIGGIGNDTLIGDGGVNTASYSYASSGVTATLSSAGDSTVSVGLNDVDKLVQIQNIIGSQGGDSLTGDNAENLLSGFTGNDTLVGSGGKDTLDGGADIDTVDYSYLNSISGVGGINVTLNGGQDVTVSGISASDIDVIRNVENIIGSNYADQIRGDQGNNLISAGAGYDTLSGGLGNDTLIGGGDFGDLADYSYVTSQFGVTVQLNGNNQIFATVQSGVDIDVLTGIENIIGTKNADSIVGDIFANSLAGFDGNDTIDGGAGANTLAGGAGNDVYILNSNAEAITEAQADGISDEVRTVLTSVSLQNYANIEGLRYTGTVGFTGLGNSENNTITGATGDDSLSGDAGNDSLIGADGFDTLRGGAGNNTLAGGNNNDIYYVESSFDVVLEIANGGTDRIVTTANSITLANQVEILEFNGIGAFTGVGNTGDNTILSGAGSDSISSLDGKDYIIGNDGSDTILGGAGSDTVDYSYVSSMAGLTVKLDSSNTANVFGLGASDQDQLVDIENLIGTKNADSITGDIQANSLAGGKGEDTLVGGDNNDTLDGGDDNDTLDYSYVTGSNGLTVTLNGAVAAIATIAANADVDIITNIENIIGTNNADRITGDIKNNVLKGGLGQDTLDGGAGSDTVDYSYLSGATGVSVALNGAGVALAVVDALDRDDLVRIENVIGSNLADTILGDGQANLIMAGNGDNLVSGGGGNDTLIGGANIDSISYSYVTSGLGINLQLNEAIPVTVTVVNNADVDIISGIENVTGTQYADSLGGDGNANILTGGSGRDTIIGNGGQDTLTGGLDNDSLDGGSGNDFVDYSYITGINGLTLQLNGSGASTLSGLSEIDIDILRNIEGVIGTNNADSISAGIDAATFIGGSGQDTLIGGLGNDYLSGGVGDDCINGGTGSNTLEGGDGNDIYVVNSIVDTIIEYANAGADTIRTSLANYSLLTTANANIENLTSTSAVQTNLVGNTANNILRGSITAKNMLSADAGNDTIYGGNNDDTLDGQTGIDSLIGGLGNDVYIITDADDVVSEDLNGGIDTIQTSLTAIDLANAKYQNVEAIRFTGGGNASGAGNNQSNSIWGANGADTLFGDSGDDFLSGGLGNNILDGGIGNDTLAGGTGNDLYIVDSVDDKIIETDLNSTDTVQTSLAIFNINESGMTSIENLVYTGGATGFSGRGNAVANSMRGDIGNDTLEGGAGADTLSGNGGSDTASYSLSTTAVSVSLVSNRGVGGDAEDDLLIGMSHLLGANQASNLLIGNAAANILTGGSFSDTLSGGLGADTLSGNDGNDLLVGGSGTALRDDATGSVTANLMPALNGAMSISLRAQAANASDWHAISLNAGNGFHRTLEYGPIGLRFIQSVNGVSQTVSATLSRDSNWHDISVTVSSTGAVVFYVDGVALATIGGPLSAYAPPASTTTLIIGDSGSQTSAILYDQIMIYNRALNASETNLGSLVTNGLVAGWDFENTGNPFADITGSGRILSASLQNLVQEIAGDTAKNSLSGGAGDDTLIGGLNADTLSGGSNNDSLSGGAGADSMSGGLGDDIYDIDNIGDVIGEALGNGTDTILTSLDSINLESINYANVENLTYTGAGSFSAAGSAANNLITSLAGADTIDSQGGDDTIISGDGNDSLIGGVGNDTIDGGLGVNTISYDYVTGPTGVTVQLNGSTYAAVSGISSLDQDNIKNIQNVIGSKSADNIVGDLNANTLIGNGGADTLSGGDQADSLVGGAVNDVLDGGSGLDSMRGGSGDDIYVVDSANDIIYEADGITGGIDTVQTSLANLSLLNPNYANVENLTFIGVGNRTGSGSSGANILVAAAGDDSLNAGLGQDTLFGNGGNDTLDGGIDADSMAGGTGDDLYLIDNINDRISEIFGQGNDTVSASVNTYTLDQNVENLVFTGVSGVTATGNMINNSITGTSGNDLLAGGMGNDTLDGNGGTDAVSYAYLTANGVTATLAAAGNSTVTAVAGSDVDLLVNISNLIGSNQADTIILNAQDASVFGSGGNDVLNAAGTRSTLDGGDGNDWVNAWNASLTDGRQSLFGGAGNDSLTGGVGGHTMDGGNDIDLVYATGTSTYGSIINLATNSFTRTDGIGTASVVRNIENIFGSIGTDCLTGDGGANSLFGNSLDDTLIGGAGNDTLDGGAENDLVDYSYVAAGLAGVTVTLAGATTVNVTGIAANDRDQLANIEHIIGTQNDDFITGDIGNNSISTGQGQDTLSGGNGGADSLIGGAGNDLYIINALGAVITEATGSGNGFIDTIQTSLNAFDMSGANYTNVENLNYGGMPGGAFSAVGSSANNTITGSTSGVNSLSGNGGNDCLIGGSQADTLDGNGDNDTLVGGAGNDTYIINTLGAVIQESSAAGSGSADTIQTTLNTFDMSGVNYTNVENLVYTGSGTFTATGSNLSNSISGDMGNDSLFGGAGNDTISGSGTVGMNSNLLLSTDALNDTSKWGTGSLSVSADVAASPDATLSADRLAEVATTSNHFIYQNANLVAGMTYTQSFFVKAAERTFVQLTGSTGFPIAFVNFNLANGTVGNATAAPGTYAINSVGNGWYQISLTLTATSTTSGRFALCLLDSDSNLRMPTYSGDPTKGIYACGAALTLSSGDDTLDGGAGIDSMLGGNGNDLYIVDNINDAIQEVAGNGIDTVQIDTTSGLANYTLAAGNNVENLVYTGTNAFTLAGNELANTITGSSTAGNSLSGGLGNDCLIGGSAADTLDGSGNADTLVGGAGNDVYIINTIGAAITEASGAGGGLDTIQTTLTTFDMSGANYNNVENLIYTGTAGGAFSAVGNASDNTITGSATGIDSLNGGAGNDYLIGGTQADSLDGGSGNDTLSGGAGADSLQGGADNDLIILNSTGFASIDGGAGNDGVRAGGIGLSDFSKIANVETIDLNDGTVDQVTLTTSQLANMISSGGALTILGNSNSASIGKDQIYFDLAGFSSSTNGGFTTYTSMGGDGRKLVVDSNIVVTQSDQILAQTYNLWDPLTSLPNSLRGAANNMALWLDASDINGDNLIDSLANGAMVSNWVDKSGNFRNALQSTTALQPVVSLNGMNGQVGVAFDGTGKTMNISGYTINPTDSYTVLGIMQSNDADSSNNALLQMGSTNGSYILAPQGNQLWSWNGTNSIGNAAISGNINQPVGNIINVTKIGTTGQTILGDNGMTTTTTTGNPSGSLSTAWNLGSSFGGQAGFNGAISELMIFNRALTDTERQQVESYLMGKWGVSSLSYAVGTSVNGYTNWQNATLAYGTTGGDTLSGSDARASSGVLDDILLAGDGNDSLFGGQGDDALRGGQGNDMLQGGAGNDDLDGGAGIDAATYINATSAVSVSLANTFRQDTQGAGSDILRNIENLVGSDFNDTLIGSGDANTITGSSGQDSVNAGANNDVIIGGAGNDTFDGSLGSDTVDYTYVAQGAGSITVQLNNADLAAVTGLGAGDIDQLVNVENILGTQNNDCIGGDASANSLVGNLGNDTLSGGAGNDTLVGGAGIDTADYSYLTTTGVSVTLNSAGNATATVSAGSDVDTLTGIENVTGGSGNDSLQGDGFVNSIAGGAGNDVIYASNGLGDTLDGGANTDTIDYSRLNLGVSVNLLTNSNSYNISLSNINSSALVGNYGFESTGLNPTLGSSAPISVFNGASIAPGAAGSIMGNALTFNNSTATNANQAYASIPNLTLGNTFAIATWVRYDATQAFGRIFDFSNGPASDNIGLYRVNTTNDLLFNIYSGGVSAGKITVTNAIVNGQWMHVAAILNGRAMSLYINGVLSGTATTNADIPTITRNSNLIGKSNWTTDGAFTGQIDGFTIYNTSITASQVQYLYAAGAQVGYTLSDTISNFENITGSAFTDCLAGDNNANLITGGASNDTLSGGLGNDTIDGGTNSDVADYSYSATGTGISVTLNSAGTVTLAVGTGDTDRLIGIEGIIGTQYADTLNGDTGDNNLSGGDGHDSISGGQGNDTLLGGTGNDTLTGGFGNDIYVVISAGDVINENASEGTDTIQTMLNTFSITNIANVENLTFIGTGDFSGTGNTLANSITGNTGNDTLSGGSGNDTLDGGAGTDIADYSYLSSATNLSVTLSAGGATVNAGAGDVDTLINIEGVTGAGGNDTITGDLNANSLTGAAGNDSLIGDAWLVGNASFELGGTGNGILGSPWNYSGTANAGGQFRDTSGLSVSRVSDGAQAVSFGNGGSLSGGVASQTLTTSSGQAYTLGFDMANQLMNGTGDIIRVDVMNGATVIATQTYSSISWNWRTYSIAFTAQSTSTTIRFTHVASPSGGDVEIDLVRVNATTGSPDTLFGGDGNDMLQGGIGNDSIDGGNNIDTVDYSYVSNGSGLVVTLNGATAVAAQVGATGDVDMLVNIENVIGTGFNDFITGDNNSNSIAGGLGDDSLTGGGNNDTLMGGSGNDTLDGSGGTADLADYSYGNIAGGISVQLNGATLATVTINMTWEMDQIANIENVLGSYNNDTIFGDSNANSLSGALGHDAISGGAGNDTLDGGVGNDVIDYSYVISSGTTNGLNGITMTLNGSTSSNMTGLVTGDQDTIRNFEHVIGTNFNDSIGGDAFANSLSGAGGNDTLAGFGNNDTLDGGAGNDCLIGTGGSDIMRGGADHDYMLIDQSFLGGGGSIDGGTGMDTVAFAANSGNLTLTTANFDSIVTNVEVLDFTSVGTNVTMSLNATDIASLTGQGLGVNTKLDIVQNAGDQISIATQAGFTFDTTTSNGVTTYTFYNSTDPHDPANQLAQINVHGS